MHATANPFGNDFPEAAQAAQAARSLVEGAPSAASPIDAALAAAADRLDRAEHTLGELNAVIMRLGSELEPILTDGSYAEPGGTIEATVEDPNIDRRSTVAKRIGRLGLRADQLGDATNLIRHRVEAILAAIEL